MELGQRLRQARLEAGLSQRALCGDLITRNMLSQIENGTARPSMDTLAALAKRLGKTVGYFLEEQTASPNQSVMEAAREALDAGDYRAVVEELADYREPDPVFDRERWFLLALAELRQAQQALEREQYPYALELLERCARAGAQTPYWTPELQRRHGLLLASVRPELASELPGEDEALVLRARLALRREAYLRAAQYLDAAEDQAAPGWALLRGECCIGLKQYSTAALYLHRAEQAMPEKIWPRLELCYRELGDYRRAYEYACRQRKN